MLPLGGSNHGRLFLEASRINHSCQPNAQHAWNNDLGHLTIHALRDIEADREITISYISGVSPGFVERQRHLMNAFSFTCVCELCSLPLLARAGSDYRLDQITTQRRSPSSILLSSLWTTPCTVRLSVVGRIAGRLLEGYSERNLRTGSGIRMDGRDSVPLDKCDTLSGSIPDFQATLNNIALHFFISIVLKHHLSLLSGRAFRIEFS